MERRYKKIKVVGKGSYGTAVLCLDQHTSKKVVIKRVDIRKLSEPKRAAALREAELLRSFQHPGGNHTITCVRMGLRELTWAGAHSDCASSEFFHIQWILAHCVRVC